MSSYIAIISMGIPSLGLSQNVVISPLKMNTLYIGIYNPISFAINGKQCSNYSLTTKNGVIRQIEKCIYEVNPTTPGQSSIYVVDKKGILIDSVQFRVKTIPDPRPEFYPSKGNDIRFERTEGVVAVLNYFDFDARFEILEYEFSAERAGTLLNTIRNVGSAYSEEVKRVIDKMKVGDIVRIENIKARGPDGRTRQLESIKLTVR